MATCLGHRFGTGCKKRSHSARAKNWKDHQLCYPCYCLIILGHEPRKGVGGKYLKPATCMSMIETTYHGSKITLSN